MVVIAPIDKPSPPPFRPCRSVTFSRSIRTCGSISLFLNSTRSDCPPAIGNPSLPYLARSPRASSNDLGLINFLSIFNHPLLLGCLYRALDLVSEFLDDGFGLFLNERIAERSQPAEDIDVGFESDLGFVALGRERKRHRLAHASGSKVLSLHGDLDALQRVEFLDIGQHLELDGNRTNAVLYL